MSSRILAVGRTGQVAHELGRGIWPTGTTVDFLDRARLDLARPGQARAIVVAARPRIVAGIPRPALAEGALR